MHRHIQISHTLHDTYLCDHVRTQESTRKFWWFFGTFSEIVSGWINTRTIKPTSRTNLKKLNRHRNKNKNKNDDISHRQIWSFPLVTITHGNHAVSQTLIHIWSLGCWISAGMVLLLLFRCMYITSLMYSKKSSSFVYLLPTWKQEIEHVYRVYQFL